MRTARGACKTTIFPRNCPLYFSSSASLAARTCTTSAVTGPLVDGEYHRGIPMSGAGCGVSMCAENLSIVHPCPKGNRSMWMFFSPHSPNFFITQSAPC
jgi:hypothetical protein